jgi:hypothetical protein
LILQVGIGALHGAIISGIINFSEYFLLMATVTETFFLPMEVERRPWSVPAAIYNLYRALLNRSETGHVFVPVRSMQFLAVMDKKEIVFVDSQSYAVSKDEGGRLILIAWQFSHPHDRDSLSDAMPCEVVFYERKNADTQLRLIAEFRHALEALDQRYRDQQLPAKGAKILSLR